MTIPESSRNGLALVPAKEVRRLASELGSAPAADPVLTFAQAREEQDVDYLSLERLLLAFRRNKWLVLGITIASVGATVGYTRLVNPVYESSATIRIDDRDDASSMLTGVAAALPGMAKAKIQTEIEVLRSRQLAENVAKALNLNLVAGPARARHLIRPVQLPPDVQAARLVLTRNSAEDYSIRQDGDDPAITLPTSVKAGTPFVAGAATLVLRRPTSGSLPAEVTVDMRPLRDAVEELGKKLTVSRPNKEAQIVKVLYESNDPLLAAAVPNLVLAEFMRSQAQTTKTEATSTVGFLRQQVASYDGQLKSAEAALGNFREEAQVVSIGDEAQAQVKRMAELQAERDQLLSERDALAAVVGKQAALGESAARNIAAFPSFITNKGMQDILMSLIELENERSQLLVRRTPENADVVAVSARIRDLDSQLTQMARAYLAGLDSKLASVNRNVASFGKQIETIPAREIAFARLSRDQKLLVDIATLLQTRLKEAEIKEAVQPGDVRVIDRALVPHKPTSPRPVWNILLGVLGGLLLGLAAAVVREALDNKVRTKEDVQKVTGGIPILGAIPRIPATSLKLNGKKKQNGSTAVARAGPPANRALITNVNSREVFAEAYRALRTNITFAAVDHANQVIVLTSALAGDGKSTSAANFAVTLAQQGSRTLLIDADLRKGVLHNMFAVKREPGLTQLLIGESSIASSIQTVPLGDDGNSLHLLTSGRIPPNPAELLGSERMRLLLEELRQQFDMIVFDTPPLTLVTDAAVLGTLADSTILVARAGVTDKRALHQAAAQLYHLRVQVSGTIVNDFNPKQSGYGYEYGYGYAPGYGNRYAYGQPR